MGTMQYYLKGSALANPTSPNLSAPRVSTLMSQLAVGLDMERVSTLMSQSAVGLDMVNPGCITAPERILEEFLSLSLSLDRKSVV